jgi:hypothetical protein
MMDWMIIAEVSWRVSERTLLKFQLAICCTWLAQRQVNTWILEHEASRISIQSAHDGGKVVIPIHRPLLPPGDAPDTHFCCRLSDPEAILLWITVHSLNLCDSQLDVASNANETTNSMVKSHFCETKSFPVTQDTHHISWDPILNPTFITASQQSV